MESIQPQEVTSVPAAAEPGLTGLAARHPFAFVTAPALICALVIAWGSLAPPEDLPEISRELWDKLQHGAAYVVFSALLLRAWLWGRCPGWRDAFTITLAVAAYGFYLEVLQHFSGYRSFDVLDELTNIVSALLGTALLTCYRRRSRQR